MRMKITEIREALLKDYLIAINSMRPVSQIKLKTCTSCINGSGPKRLKEESRRILIESSLKTVVAIACKYRGSCLSFTKLIEEGNKGLIYAVDSYDEKRDGDFLNYAAWHAEGAIIDSLIECRKGV